MLIKYPRPVFHWDVEKGEYTKPNHRQHDDAIDALSFSFKNVLNNRPIKDITKEVNEINSVERIQE